MKQPSSPALPAGLPLASLRRRLACLLYESLVVLGVLAVLFLLPQAGLSLALGGVLPGPLLFLHVFVALGAYFVWFWHRRGQTLAMQTWRLKLVRLDGQAPNLKQLLLRYLLAWASLSFYGAGLFWAIFDRERQFLHDRLAGTRLIDAPPTRASPPPPTGT
ncbi:MAG: RDD family protein [Rhodocyclaceae bacterium]|nr:RDD family protein [Rhodocyclaceae bacterium]